MHNQSQIINPLCEDLETRSNHIQDSDISLETDLTTENDCERNSPILEAENGINNY